MTRIHATAIVDPQARLHTSVEVGPYSIIGAGVEVGEGSWIGPHVVINGPCTIGRRNKIYPFSSIGQLSQDKSAKATDATRVEIGDDNLIRENVTINRGTLKDKGVTRIGNDNWLMAGSHVAHDCVVGDHTVLANCVLLAGHVHVEDWAILGGFTGVHQYCRIGAHGFTGGGAVVLRDQPPFVISEGHPAKPRGINKEGLRRRGFPPQDIEEIEDLYKLVYRSRKVVAAVKEELAVRAKASKYAAQMLEFIEKSKRALMR